MQGRVFAGRGGAHFGVEGGWKGELTYELTYELTHERSYERWTSVYERLREIGRKKICGRVAANGLLQRSLGRAGDGLRRVAGALVQDRFKIGRGHEVSDGSGVVRTVIQVMGMMNNCLLKSNCFVTIYFSTAISK